MDAERQITVWLKRMDDEPNEAQRAIWEAFHARVTSYVQKKLASVPKRVADEDDLASSAMVSLFKVLQSKKYPGLNDTSGLWRMLLKIAARKVSGHIDRETAARRGGGKVRGESVFTKPGCDINSVPCEPSSLFCEALMKELLEKIRHIGDERTELIVTRKLAGYSSNREIAHELKCAERTVERKLELVRDSWTA